MFVIDFIYSIIGTPLGYVMWVCYLLVQNFGLAIVIFTLLVKAAMFPLQLKQQKNMAFSQQFAPRVKEIQQKYRNNQQKQQEEMQKLQKEGYNPMGGCAPMLLTFVLLFGVIDVVYKPMTHMEHIDWSQSGGINATVEIAKQTAYATIIMSSPEDEKIILEYKDDPTTIAVTTEKLRNDLEEGYLLAEHAPAVFKENESTGVTYADIQRLGIDKWNDTIVASLAGDTSRLSDEVRTALNTQKSMLGSLQRELISVQVYDSYPEPFKTAGTLTEETLTKLDSLKNNMNLFGIDLGKTPTFAFNELLIIPIIAFILSLAQTIISQWIQKKTNPDAPNMGGGMKLFMYIMPLFSLFIAFSVPAGVGFYWGISYLFGIAQSLIIYKFWPPEKMRAEALAKVKAKGGTVNVTATVKSVDEEGNETVRVEKLDNLSAKDQKEYYRKKLEEARRADAEKYGEAYEDDENDEDKK